jgi:hypothetical protein
MDLEAISGMLPLIDKMLSRFGTHDKVKEAISLPKGERWTECVFADVFFGCYPSHCVGLYLETCQGQ